MERNSEKYRSYVAILKEELVPAMGCTEPIALAYAAAQARTVLRALPDRVLLQVSGSIIKNVKSVIVPNTGHLKGMAAAAAAGIVAGSAERELEVIADVSLSEQEAIKDYLDRVQIEVEHIDWGHVFDIQVTAFGAGSYPRQGGNAEHQRGDHPVDDKQLIFRGLHDCTGRLKKPRVFS